MGDFAAYGLWFQQRNVPSVEGVEVELVDLLPRGFAVTLADGERFVADRVVIATGLAGFAYVPPVLASLPPALATHTSRIKSFAAFKGREVAVIGAGQSALEAAALLHEAGAQPQLLVGENSILWQTRISLKRSLWRRLRSPISGLGTGPKAWGLTHFPGVMHRVPATWRTRFVRNHLPAEGAWWLRDRVENRLPVHFGVTVVEAHEAAGRVVLGVSPSRDGSGRQLVVDHVIAGSGYDIDVDRLEFIHPKLRCAIQRLEGAPRLNAAFETSVSGLHSIGPTSAMSFGPALSLCGGRGIHRAGCFSPFGGASFVRDMTDLSPTIIYLSGAGGGAPDLNVFREGIDDTTRIEVIGYPGWKRYVADGFSAEALIADLAEEIAIRVPLGPIRIIGHSIGGHFGYAAALRLQSMGREIAGLCAIDSFMIASSKPTSGWRSRAFVQGLQLLRERRFGEFTRFFAIEVLARSGQTCRQSVTHIATAIFFLQPAAFGFQV